MIIWPGKASDAVLDYVWEPEIDGSDTIASIDSISVTDGDVVIDSSGIINSAQQVQVWLSNGTAGTTAKIDIEITTTDGRTFDETIAIQIIDRDAELLDEFRLRYAEFDDVRDDRIIYWINDADRVVDTSWPTASQSPAKFAHAAHMMVETGAIDSDVPMGVKSFKSGTFSATLSEKKANAEGYSSSKYGKEFLKLRRAAFSGPRSAWPTPARIPNDTDLC